MVLRADPELVESLLRLILSIVSHTEKSDGARFSVFIVHIKTVYKRIGSCFYDSQV